MCHSVNNTRVHFIELNALEFHFSFFVCIFTNVFVLECIGNGVSHKMNHYGKLLYIFPGALKYIALCIIMDLMHLWTKV
jgi:hypothetical protein